MSMACSSDFHLRSLNYLTSAINRMAVFTTAQPTLDTAGVWGSTTAKICGTTSPTIGSPGSTTNGFVVKITSAAGLSVDTSGCAGHIVLFASSQAKYVTTCTTRNIQGTDTVSIPAWYIRIADPTSS